MPKNDFSYTLKLRIYKDEKFFGTGIAQLLENVNETHSLMQASRNMSMAYTKALQIIKRAENALGYRLLIRKTGGKSGGGSYLTDNAIELLKIYRSFEESIESFAYKQFQILVKEMDKLQ